MLNNIKGIDQKEIKMKKILLRLVIHLMVIIKLTNSQRPIPSNSSTLLNLPTSSQSNNNLYQTNNINNVNQLSSSSMPSGKNRGGGSITSKLSSIHQLKLFGDLHAHPSQPPPNMSQQQIYHSSSPFLPANQTHLDFGVASSSGGGRYGFNTSGYLQNSKPGKRRKSGITDLRRLNNNSTNRPASSGDIRVHPPTEPHVYSNSQHDSPSSSDRVSNSNSEIKSKDPVRKVQDLFRAVVSYIYLLV